jgi:hypothetical protein
MILILRDPTTYKDFLACRGSMAQQLLDLVQDVLKSGQTTFHFRELIHESLAPGLVLRVEASALKSLDQTCSSIWALPSMFCTSGGDENR